LLQGPDVVAVLQQVDVPARSHWGGLCNGELKRLMLRHAFQLADTVVFLVSVDNLRSQRAVEKIGAARVTDPRMIDYHDREWGVPVHDDSKHFEFLILEGAQAGLSWKTILHKREGYRRAFADFDPAKVARFTTKRVDKLVIDTSIIRNRQKIERPSRTRGRSGRCTTNSEASTPMSGGRRPAG
jgi:hypothetical protein